ncbi:MAG: toll/interleukin-1 receptor domain-containing protein [Chthoniobacterales bacterium]|nr:toll/interleukin-1 receptor domain-containing protein [Chthoniobacterales bacterium]
MTNGDTAEATAKVFISYTQESDEHSHHALALSNALRGLGFESDIDQYHVNERWPSWMEGRLEWADFVLVICTETYLRRWKNDEKDGVGLGAQWESLLTRQYLYESPQRNDKFIPVVFESADLKFIPKPLADVTRVVVGPQLEFLDRLRSRLLGIPPAEMPPIRTSLAPIAVAEGFFQKSSLIGENQFDPQDIGLHHEPESIASNLFPVVFPETIYSAKIGVKRGSKTEFFSRVKKAWEKLGNSGKPPSDFFVDYGIVYTFQNFEQPLWKELFANKTLINPGHFKASKWAESAVMGDRSKFIKLLNRCLQHLCEHNSTPYQMAYSKKMKCHLFAVKAGTREGTLKALALKTFGDRTIYKAIPDKKSDDPNAIQHWKHEAFRHKFMRFGQKWYFILVPFWAFTCDGVNSPSKWQKKSSSNMRKPEKNRAVLGHVLFWASVLCREPDLIESGEGFRIQRPIGLSLSPSIKDADWVKLAKSDEQKEMTADMGVLL